jgi:hypothetical protein
MTDLSYDTTLGGSVAARARVPYAVVASVPALNQRPALRRTNKWFAIAAADLTCGLSTDMKAHQRRPRENSS